MQSDKQKRPRGAKTAAGRRTQEEESPMSIRKRRARSPERGKRVAEARKRAGLSQQALADKVGIGRQSLLRIEAGRQDPSVTIALALAAAVGEPVERLFGSGR
jgi:putative transcriptional regulator